MFSGRFGFWEIALIVLVLLIFFGPKKLPELGRAIGGSLKEFKKATKEMQEAVDEDGQSNSETQATAQKSAPQPEKKA